MTVNWSEFRMNGTVTTEGGQTANLLSDKSSFDCAVLTLSEPVLKLTEQDLRDFISLFSKEGYPRINVK